MVRAKVKSISFNHGHDLRLDLYAVSQLKKEDYDLPTLAPRLVSLAHRVSSGLGFQLIR